MIASNRFVVAAAGMMVMLGGTGCFKATFEDPTVARGETHEEWRSRYVLGLIGDGEVDATSVCQHGVAEVRTGGNLATSATAIGTLFIYTPRKVYITCAAQ